MSDREVPRGEDFNLADLGMGILAVARTVAGGRVMRASIELEVHGSGGRCLVDPRGSALSGEIQAAERARRDARMIAAEAIGGALSILCRLDHVWCDEDVRETLTHARASLARAGSKIKERIDE